jgi:hypothetical protein
VVVGQETEVVLVELEGRRKLLVDLESIYFISYSRNLQIEKCQTSVGTKT